MASSELRSLQLAETKITTLETEVQRYKSTITKMEKQWREATTALNEIKLNNNN